MLRKVRTHSYSCAINNALCYTNSESTLQIPYYYYYYYYHSIIIN